MTISREELKKLKPVTKEDDERLRKEAKKEDRKGYTVKWRLNNKEKACSIQKKYDRSHKGERAKYHRKHNKEHKEEKRIFNEEHKEEIKEHNKQYYQKHREEIIKYVEEYRQTEAGKAAKKKSNDRRRGLGFLELNEPFKGSEGHHINKDTIVYIPKELHKSVYHNLKTGRGMVEINNVAVEWLIDIGELMPLPESAK